MCVPYFIFRIRKASINLLCQALTDCTISKRLCRIVFFRVRMHRDPLILASHHVALREWLRISGGFGDLSVTGFAGRHRSRQRHGANTELGEQRLVGFGIRIAGGKEFFAVED